MLLNPKAPWGEKHSKFCDPPSYLPSIPPSSNSTLHLLRTLGHPHSTDEEQTLLPLLVGGGGMFFWDMFWPCLADPDNPRHTLSWQLCLGCSLQISLQRSPGHCLQLCRAAALSCAGGTRSLNRNQLETLQTPVWGLCLSNVPELGYHCLNSFQLLLFSFMQPTKYLSDASFWPVECVCLLSDKTKRSEIEVNRKKWQHGKIQINARDGAS